jgi:PAS domain S-box-containing protein
MMKKLRVLNVEDSPQDAALHRRHLERAGYDLLFERVDTAAALQAALAAQEWDIILCDYSMPQFDAKAALALVQQSGLDIPFIIISGTIGEDIAVQAMLAGAHDYLIKDNLTRLLPAIERELEEARNRQARRQAEASLQQSLEWLWLAVQVSNIGLWDWDLQTNQVVYSREWKSQLGYEEHEIGNEFSEWESRVHPDDLAFVLERVQNYLARPENPHEVEFRMRHKNGSWRYIYTRWQSGADARLPLGHHRAETGRKCKNATHCPTRT